MMSPPFTKTDWTLGASDVCDVLIDHSNVSGSHCRLTKTDQGYTLEDLGSSNGTMVNGKLINAGPIDVTTSDEILLALIVPMPWPDPAVASEIFTIGSSTECSIVLDHLSVSPHHASLIIDPNGQTLIVDHDSRDGVWIGDRRVNSATVNDETTIRLGSIKITARQIKQHADGLGPIFPKKTLIGLSLFAALFAAVLLVFSVVHSSMSPSVLVDKPEVAVARLETPPAIIEPSIDNAIDLSADTTSKVFDASDVPSADAIVNLDPWQIVDRSMFVLVVKVGEKKFDFATAWMSSSGRLITNAHVIESVRRHGYQLSAVHLNSGKETEISTMGSHPSYNAQLQKLYELNYRIDQAMKLVSPPKEDATVEVESGRIAIANLSTKMEELKELKIQQPWARRAVDAFDAGYIELSEPVQGATALVVGKVLIQPKKQLRLASTELERDSAVADDDIAGPVRIRKLIAVEPVLLTGKQWPFRWIAQFPQQEREWEFYLYDGCPILDLKGRLAGMFRGPKRMLSPSNDQSPSDSPSAQIDIIPLSVIAAVSGGPNLKVK